MALFTRGVIVKECRVCNMLNHVFSLTFFYSWDPLGEFLGPLGALGWGRGDTMARDARAMVSFGAEFHWFGV